MNNTKGHTFLSFQYLSFSWKGKRTFRKKKKKSKWILSVIKINETKRKWTRHHTYSSVDTICILKM